MAIHRPDTDIISTRRFIYSYFICLCILQMRVIEYDKCELIAKRGGREIVTEGESIKRRYRKPRTSRQSAELCTRQGRWRCPVLLGGGASARLRKGHTRHPALRAPALALLTPMRGVAVTTNNECSRYELRKEEKRDAPRVTATIT